MRANSRRAGTEAQAERRNGLEHSIEIGTLILANRVRLRWRQGTVMKHITAELRSRIRGTRCISRTVDSSTILMHRISNMIPTRNSNPEPTRAMVSIPSKETNVNIGIEMPESADER